MVDEPFELTRPATIIAPPVTLIDPVEPPLVVTATLLAWLMVNPIPPHGELAQNLQGSVHETDAAI